MNQLSPDFEPTGLVPALFRYFPGKTYRWVTIAFLLASFSHLWLEDATHPDWMLANGIYVLGMLVMVARPGLLAWLLCGAGLLIPLLFLRDQLTQSMLMFLVCVAGAVHHVRWLFGRQDAPRDFLHTLGGLTVATYSLATLHKLNVDFFEPKTSCANYGIDELITYFHLPREVRALDPIWPWVAIVFEAVLAALFSRGRHRLAWWLGLVFHLPLTLTMAPAFVFVMWIGWVAFATPEDFDALAAAWRAHKVKLLGLAAVLCGVSLCVHGSWPEPTMVPREALLWLGLLWLPVAFGRGLFAHQARPTRTRWYLAVVGIFWLNGLTPYLGVQYQHAAAMLSNLRIDEGCWNHAFIPESVRLTDDYIRVDHAFFGEPGRLEEYELILKEQLWNPPQMRQMQRNWCKHDVRPVRIEGTYRGRRFVVEDLCPPPGSATPPDLPFDDDGVFGVELFPEYLRFQKNLMRACPQACIH